MNNAFVHLNGNLVRDPELREVGPTKAKVASFSVAVNTTNKKPDGTYEANFYDVSLWGNQGERFMEMAKKGMRVYVCGDLSMVEYVSNRDNQKHTRLRVNAFQVLINEPKDKTAQPAQQPMDPLPEEDPYA